jgi:hypothetical protein
MPRCWPEGTEGRTHCRRGGEYRRVFRAGVAGRISQNTGRRTHSPADRQPRHRQSPARRQRGRLAIMGRPPAELDAWRSLCAAPAGDRRQRRSSLGQARQRCRRGSCRRNADRARVGIGHALAMEEFFRERSIKPRIGMEMGSNEAIKQAVVAGLGISFISLHTLGLELSAGRLCILKVEGTPVMRRWHIVRHRSKHLTPALAAFWDFVVEVRAGLPEKAGVRPLRSGSRCASPPLRESGRKSVLRQIRRCGRARQWLPVGAAGGKPGRRSWRRNRRFVLHALRLLRRRLAAA